MAVGKISIVAAAAALAAPASALPLLQSISLDTPQISALGGQTQSLTFFDPFDPSLGTLDSVEAQIFGQLNIQWGFRGLSPTPGVWVDYLVMGQFSQALDGLGAGDFDWPIAPTLGFLATVRGDAEAGADSAVFNYRFHFDAATDLTGQAPVSGGTTIPGADPDGLFVMTDPPIVFALRRHLEA